MTCLPLRCSFIQKSLPPTSSAPWSCWAATRIAGACTSRPQSLATRSACWSSTASAFEIADAVLDQHAERVAKLCGLDVHAPAIRVAAQQLQGALDVGGNDFWIKEQRRGKHVIERGNSIALVPGEFTQHGLLRSHSASMIARKHDSGPQNPQTASLRAR